MAFSSPFDKPKTAGLSGVKNIIAIASGKGGVGKSTVTVNLAVALAQSGHKVGLMDADIYGPSQPGMLGSQNVKPEIVNDMLKPMRNHGIDFISMGLLVNENTPVIWRAPMAMKMIQQFINSVMWGELDYLLIDLPPGTGDVQLTLAQQASLTGAIIVTTPQQVAVNVAIKGLKMFEQVKVPIVGIIENMSGFTCNHCDKVTEVFKDGGGKKMAAQMNVPYLGSLPLDPEIMMAGDDGTPVLIKSKESPAAKAFLTLADSFKKSIDQNLANILAIEPTTIDTTADGKLAIVWPDKHEAGYTPYNLRLKCACAACVDEDTGKKILDVRSVPLDIKVTTISKVGRYGLSIGFSDGHNTGIYIYEKLRSFCECTSCVGEKTEDSFSI